MLNRFENDNPPLCRFGPGGDFTFDLWLSRWFAESAGPASSPNNRLDKILASLSEIIAAMLGECPEDYTVESEKYPRPAKHIIFPLAKLKGADKTTEPDKTAHPAPAPAVKNAGSLPEQQMLFPVDGGNSRKASNKPKYRIRTYRRASKKKALVGIFGKGSLFDDNLKSARTA